MQHFKGFKKYTPENPLPDGFPLENIGNPYVADLNIKYSRYALTQEVLEGGMQYLFEKDENGDCWYDLNKGFDKDTWKIAYEPETFKVVGFGKDAEKMMPHGNNIIEVKSVPSDIDILRFKVDVAKHIVYKCSDEVRKRNRAKQTSILRDAIAHLYALDCLPSLTQVERDEKAHLTNYVIAVKRTDISMESPEWPESPLK